MNRDESLAYWFLRLNGFFLLRHFVVHTEEPSEIDFLAIRPPDVFEEVGGQPHDWDHQLVTEDEQNRLILLLCEVKGGRTYDPATIFRPRELQYAIPRLGFLTPMERENALAELRISRRYSPGNGLELRKLLIAHQDLGAGSPCDFIELAYTWRFLFERLVRYKNEKAQARILFGADRIEELLAAIERAAAWRTGDFDV